MKRFTTKILFGLCLAVFAFMASASPAAAKCDGWAESGATHRNAGNGCQYTCSGDSWSGPSSCDGQGNGQFQGAAAKTPEDKANQARAVEQAQKAAEQVIAKQGTAATAAQAASTADQRAKEATRQQAMVEAQRQNDVDLAKRAGASAADIAKIEADSKAAAAFVAAAQGTNRGQNIVGSGAVNAAAIAEAGYDPNGALATGNVSVAGGSITGGVTKPVVAGGVGGGGESSVVYTGTGSCNVNEGGDNLAVGAKCCRGGKVECGGIGICSAPGLGYPGVCADGTGVTDTRRVCSMQACNKDSCDGMSSSVIEGFNSCMSEKGAATLGVGKGAIDECRARACGNPTCTFTSPAQTANYNNCLGTKSTDTVRVSCSQQVCGSNSCSNLSAAQVGRFNSCLQTGVAPALTSSIPATSGVGQSVLDQCKMSACNISSASQVCVMTNAQQTAYNNCIGTNATNPVRESCGVQVCGSTNCTGLNSLDVARFNTCMATGRAPSMVATNATSPNTSSVGTNAVSPNSSQQAPSTTGVGSQVISTCLSQACGGGSCSMTSAQREVYNRCLGTNSNNETRDACGRQVCGSAKCSGLSPENITRFNTCLATGTAPVAVPALPKWWKNNNGKCEQCDQGTAGCSYQALAQCNSAVAIAAAPADQAARYRLGGQNTCVPCSLADAARYNCEYTTATCGNHAGTTLQLTAGSQCPAGQTCYCPSTGAKLSALDRCPTNAQVDSTNRLRPCGAEMVSSAGSGRTACLHNGATKYQCNSPLIAYDGQCVTSTVAVNPVSPLANVNGAGSNPVSPLTNNSGVGSTVLSHCAISACGSSDCIPSNDSQRRDYTSCLGTNSSDSLKQSCTTQMCPGQSICSGLSTTDVARFTTCLATGRAPAVRPATDPVSPNTVLPLTTPTVGDSCTGIHGQPTGRSDQNKYCCNGKYSASVCSDPVVVTGDLANSLLLNGTYCGVAGNSESCKFCQSKTSTTRNGRQWCGGAGDVPAGLPSLAVNPVSPVTVEGVTVTLPTVGSRCGEPHGTRTGFSDQNKYCCNGVYSPVACSAPIAIGLAQANGQLTGQQSALPVRTFCGTMSNTGDCTFCARNGSTYTVGENKFCRFSPAESQFQIDASPGNPDPSICVASGQALTDGTHCCEGLTSITEMADGKSRNVCRTRTSVASLTQPASSAITVCNDADGCLCRFTNSTVTEYVSQGVACPNYSTAGTDSSPECHGTTVVFGTDFSTACKVGSGWRATCSTGFKEQGGKCVSNSITATLLTATCRVTPQLAQCPNSERYLTAGETCSSASGCTCANGYMNGSLCVANKTLALGESCDVDASHCLCPAGKMIGNKCSPKNDQSYCVALSGGSNSCVDGYRYHCTSTFGPVGKNEWTGETCNGRICTPGATTGQTTTSFKICRDDGTAWIENNACAPSMVWSESSHRCVDNRPFEIIGNTCTIPSARDYAVHLPQCNGGSYVCQYGVGKTINNKWVCPSSTGSYDHGCPTGMFFEVQSGECRNRVVTNVSPDSGEVTTQESYAGYQCADAVVYAGGMARRVCQECGRVGQPACVNCYGQDPSDHSFCAPNLTEVQRVAGSALVIPQGETAQEVVNDIYGYVCPRGSTSNCQPCGGTGQQACPIISSQVDSAVELFPSCAELHARYPNNTSTCIGSDAGVITGEATPVVTGFVCGSFYPNCASNRQNLCYACGGSGQPTCNGIVSPAALPGYGTVASVSECPTRP